MTFIRFCIAVFFASFSRKMHYQNMYTGSYYSKNAEAYICVVKVKAYISSFKILVALATP